MGKLYSEIQTEKQSTNCMKIDMLKMVVVTVRKYSALFRLILFGFRQIW